MTEKQMRYALKANYGWGDKKFNKFFADHAGDWTDEDYNRAIAQYGHINVRFADGLPITHAELANDDLVHSYDNNFGEFR